jgi:FKBP-type peptidyl-prolyl cis-trans isomerase
MLFWGLTHAALSKYQQKGQAVRESCQAERAKLTPQQLKQTNCVTPQISLVSRSRVKPGGTVDVAINGTFPAGTVFVFQSDSVEVLKESCTANSYRATVKVAPGEAPRTISVTALTPAPCCKSAYLSGALTIAANYAWEMHGSNGWKVKAMPLPSDPARSQEMLYTLEFYRGSESAPFTKRRATFYPAEGDSNSFSFSISGQDESSMNVQQQLEALTKQLQNPSLSDADRDKLMKKMQDLMTQMTKTMQDPGYIKKLQEQEQEFGCNGIHLNLQNGALTGNMNCSQKAGGSIKITGTMTQLP